MDGLLPPAVGHDFMFSESELSDILEFMQRSDGADGAGPNSLGPPPFFGSAPTSMSLSMQFLPHAPAEVPLGLDLPLQSPAPSYSSQDDVLVKREGCEAHVAGALGGSAVNGSSTQLFPPVVPMASSRGRAAPAARGAPAPERSVDPAGGGSMERPHISAKKGPSAL